MSTDGQQEVGCDTLVRLVKEAGIDVCFANPGTTEMHIVDALAADGDVRAVLGLHENVVTGAADGFARMSGRAAMTLLHLGPGLANGLANLHNAKRSGVPVLNVVGDMAVWHSCADAPLQMDIEALARTVSGWVATPRVPLWLEPMIREALGWVAAPLQPGRSRVATLILPHDLQWEPTCADAPAVDVSRPPPKLVPFDELLARDDEQQLRDAAAAEAAAAAVTAAAAAAEAAAAAVAAAADGDADGDGDGAPPPPEPPEPAKGVRAFMREVAAALREAGPGGGALYLGGDALCEPTLSTAAAVARASGALLLCPNSFSRVDRGRGRPAVQRVPYFPQQAQTYLRQFGTLVLVGTTAPVAQFGYADGPSSLVSEATALYDVAFADLRGALTHLATLLQDAPAPAPAPQSPPAAPPPPPPPLPTGKLTASKMCQLVARLQPAESVVVDESLTSGTAYWEASEASPPFSHLALTGGAIGVGPPLAVGAAVACPARRVINLQADGSGLYTAQALWTQARERLNVTTVVCANNAYHILKLELARQKPRHGGKGAVVDGLTNLQNPTIDWVQLAAGYGVPAVAVATADEFAREFSRAVEAEGPHVVVAML